MDVQDEGNKTGALARLTWRDEALGLVCVETQRERIADARARVTRVRSWSSPLNSTRMSKHLQVTPRSNKVSPTRNDGAVLHASRCERFRRPRVCVVAWLVWLAISVQFVVNPVVGAVGFTLALLVFWSRLYLRRHDLRETLVGAFLGLLGGPGHGLVACCRGGATPNEEA